MKNEYVMYACMLILGICMNAWGSSKQKKSSSEVYGKPVTLESCMQYTDESPVTRAWGNGEYFQLSTAKNMAEAQARSTFSKAIAIVVTAALRDQSSGTSFYTGDDKRGKTAHDKLGG